MSSAKYWLVISPQIGRLSVQLKVQFIAGGKKKNRRPAPHFSAAVRGNAAEIHFYLAREEMDCHAPAERWQRAGTLFSLADCLE